MPQASTCDEGKQFDSHLVAQGSKAKSTFHLLKNMFYLPLLVLMGIFHYWQYIFFCPGGLSKWKAPFNNMAMRAFFPFCREERLRRYNKCSQWELRPYAAGSPGGAFVEDEASGCRGWTVLSFAFFKKPEKNTLTWHLAGGPSKRKVIFQGGRLSRKQNTSLESYLECWFSSSYGGAAGLLGVLTAGTSNLSSEIQVCRSYAQEVSKSKERVHRTAGRK